MSRPHVIESEVHLFDFDSFEITDLAALDLQLLMQHSPPPEMSHPVQRPPLQSPRVSAASTPAECVEYHPRNRLCELENLDIKGEETLRVKGKGRSRPVDIQPRDTVTAEFDSFSFSSGEARNFMDAAFSSFPSSSSSTSTPHSASSLLYSPGAISNSSYQTDLTSPGSSYNSDMTRGDVKLSASDKGKGKAQDTAPCLPPLSFSPSEYTRGETNWPVTASPSPAGEPSSFMLPPLTPTGPNSGYDSSSTSPESPSPHTRNVSRHRSLSSLSTHSAKSLAARSMSRIRVKLGKATGSGNLARKLLVRKCDELNDNYPAYDGSQLSFDISAAEQGNYYPSTPSSSPIFHIDMDRSFSGTVTAPPSPDYYSNPAHRLLLRTKGQPPLTGLPFLQTVAPLEPIHAIPIDYFTPILVPTRSLFDDALPKELQLTVMKSLVALHETEHEQAVQQVSWTATKASKHRWVGRDKGIAELVKFSRVSKSWQRLVFDGQLWSDLDLRSFPKVPASLLLRLTTYSGQFVRTINFAGHSRLTSAVFSELTQSVLSYSPSSDDHFRITQLTDINLIGCSSLTTYSLHDILIHSPSLRKLRLRGSTAVTNATCEVLARHCPDLLSLDLNRCYNVDADGILSLILPFGSSKTILPMKELRISGLRRVNDKLLAALGKYLPYLEVLDLSGARELHNSALDAFVACTDDEDAATQTITLTSREAGRDPGDPTKYKRRLTRLRHLSLSSCPLLTDIACSHLAYALPRIECLELAGIGSELKDFGLVRLLNTTPLIRRLDLEEACDITDAVIEALTPVPPAEGSRRNLESPSAQPGAVLEHLVLSYAANLTNEALSALIRACTKLRTLELDNTRVNGAVIREFVRLSRRRQAVGSSVVAIDCRGVSENVVKDLAEYTRTRKGWRAWDARKLGFLDSRDDERLGVGSDECDEWRVALKTFYSWQTVDLVTAAREKRRKAQRKAGRDSSRSGNEEDYFSKGSSRWWPTGIRRGSGFNSPTLGASPDRDGCFIM